MKRGDAFPSQRLKAEDIKGHRVTVTIEDIKVEKVGQDDDQKEKPVAYFLGKEKALVLNVTNWARLEEFLGSDESDDWIGKLVVLGTERVDFQGKRVDAIRVIGVPGQSKPEPVPEPESEDDSVPF